MQGGKPGDALSTNLVTSFQTQAAFGTREVREEVLSLENESLEDLERCADLYILNHEVLLH